MDADVWVVVGWLGALVAVFVMLGVPVVLAAWDLDKWRQDLDRRRAESRRKGDG